MTSFWEDFEGWTYRNRREHQQRYKLYAAQGGLCHWCKLPMVGLTGALSPTIDHLEPRGEKGTKGWCTMRPAVSAHAACNNARGHLPAPPAATMEDVKRIWERWHQRGGPRK